MKLNFGRLKNRISKDQSRTDSNSSSFVSLSFIQLSSTRRYDPKRMYFRHEALAIAEWERSKENHVSGVDRGEVSQTRTPNMTAREDNI